jgi:DNA-binding transcriptional MerR regulator
MQTAGTGGYELVLDLQVALRFKVSDMQHTLQIGEAADQAGLASSAIRYYESLGILPDPVRTDSGYRGYTSDDVDLLRFVARLRALEFPLSSVREIVGLRREGIAPCPAVRAAIAREATAIERRIEDLRRLRKELRSLEAQAKDLPDDWPEGCVCNVLAPTRQSRETG